MVRPPNSRKVDSPPPCACFKPAGVPAARLQETILTLDEYEAIRLVDLEGLYQEQAAERMAVSRQTVGRILETGRRKVADALVHGKALRIEGGPCELRREPRQFACQVCGHAWALPCGGGRPAQCPACGAEAIHRTDAGRERGRRRRGGSCVT